MNNIIQKAICISTVIGAVASTMTFAQSNNDHYVGSSFNEVWSVVEDQNFTPKSDIEINEFNAYNSKNTLPIYPVNAKTIFLNGDTDLKRDAVRTVSERFDYYDRIPKLIHSNGACVAGEWKITKKTPYSGQFASFASGLFIGRFSVTLDDVMSGTDRGFGIAGKIFPTSNPDEIVTTGNFFTVDVLLGTDIKHVLDTRATNEPKTGFKLSLMGLVLKMAKALSFADENPSFRPLTQVASLGLNDSSSVQMPKWIRLSADSQLKRNNSLDFRSELVTAFKENNHNVKYYIEVSNTTSDKDQESGWEKIGEINLNRVKVGYGCDRRLHFSHPKLK